MDLINIPFSMVMLSKRNVGKTVLAEYIVNKLLDEKKLDAVYIFSKTCKLGDNWRTIPEKYRYEFVDYKKIGQLMKYQTEVVKAHTKKMQSKKMQSKNKKDTVDKPNKKLKQICLVFDDVIDSSASANKGEFINLMNELFSRGRHFKISVMICNQYVKAVITPTIRSNIDYFFISCNTNEVLFFVYSLVIYKGTKNEFVEFINNSTIDHYFMMYNNLTNEIQRYSKIKANIDYNESKIGENKY
jgi:hypothetical protein